MAVTKKNAVFWDVTEINTRSKIFLGSRVLSVREADNLTAIYNSIVYTMGILNILQPYKPPRPAMVIDVDVDEVHTSQETHL
jgi:Trm5-related predicted tRNA methylase